VRGWRTFLRPREFKDISQACKHGPVVLLNAHPEHCDAIILLRSGTDPLHIPLPDVTRENLKHQRGTLQDILRCCSVRTRSVESSRLFGKKETFTSKSTQERFEGILNWLWMCVVGPIFKVLELQGIAEGRIWWCSTGAFAGFPLHAASATDAFVHSYTATLGALIEGQAKVGSSSLAKIGAVGVTHSAEHREGLLPGVGKEIKTITSIVGQPNVNKLVGEKATVPAVKSMLQDYSWVHLACHGKQDLVNPPKSHLHLYEGILELGTILQMPLENAEFVYLAACQTAMGDSQMVNESFHLAGGFIAAGFQGAIGTMWSMTDSDGPFVADAVYSYLFQEGRRSRASDTARALQVAVRKMRDSGVPCERWVPFIHMGV
ncbi:CHAT domain-containing protein, partial [Mycena crocata]